MIDERTLFVRLMYRAGSPAPQHLRLELAAPIADDGETDCWTHAYDYARATGATYVEGICFRAKPDGSVALAVHAWCEGTTPFGGRERIELTRGYEHAYGHRGIPVDLDSDFAAQAAAEHQGGRRVSAIELSIIELRLLRNFLDGRRPSI